MQICPPLNIPRISLLTTVAFSSKKRSCAQTLTIWRRDQLTPFKGYLFNKTAFQVPTCFLNWKVKIRNTLGTQTANAMAAKKILKSQGAFFNKKNVNKFFNISFAFCDQI